MPHAITVPRLGWSMDEGTFGEWLKRDGDVIGRGDPLFVLEGEKSAQDIESLDSGILRIPPDAPRSGDIVRVGQVLGFLVESGEPAPASVKTAVFSAPAPSSSSPTVVEGGVAASPLGVAALHQSSAAAAVHSRSTPHPVSPRARRVARELGVDCSLIQGTGRTGRVRECDVRRAAGEKGKAPLSVARPFPVEIESDASLPFSPPAPPAEATRPDEFLPITPIRRTIAARMLAGVRDAAPVTLHTKCDATNLVAWREQMRRSAGEQGTIPGYNAALVKLAAAALRQHPQLTHQWDERGIRVPAGMHIAVAVETEAGLLAPVLRDVDQLTIAQIEEQLRHLAENARAGRLSPADQQGGVFTITSLGAFGVDAFTPIINLPQSAILGVGRIVREPAVVDDAVVPRDRLTLSLTFDHRVVDGAPAARFLQTLSQAIESPEAWLLR